MLDYALSDRAARDLEAAQSWYRQRGAEHAQRFLDDFVLALRIARERPLSCPRVGPAVRAVRCKRFSYRIYFVPLETRIDVLAVYHTARDPSRWDDPNRE